MNLRHFDLNLLVALDVLLTERNVTRAGERLFLTQPAVAVTSHVCDTHFRTSYWCALAETSS